MRVRIGQDDAEPRVVVGPPITEPADAGKAIRFLILAPIAAVAVWYLIWKWAND